MLLFEEIRIHSADENSTSVGPHAIRLSLNPHFQRPTSPGFHLFDHAGNLHNTETSYEQAKKIAAAENLIIVWREDLITPALCAD